MVTILYVTGVIVVFILFIATYIIKKWELTLGELILGIILSLMSWLPIGLVLFTLGFIWFLSVIPKILDWKIWDIKIFKSK